MREDIKKYTVEELKILMLKIRIGSNVLLNNLNNRDIKTGIITKIDRKCTSISDICKICAGRIGIDGNEPQCRMYACWEDDYYRCEISHIFEEFITEEEMILE